MTRLLSIGTYVDADTQPLKEMGAQFVPDLGVACDLDDAARADVTAIAFKGSDPFDETAMDCFPALGLIANFGVGYDAIDVDAAKGRGIAVTNTPDVLNDDVADLAVAMWLMQGRRMLQADAYVRSGTWAEGTPFPLNRKVSGGTAGILGLGRIGYEIADRLAAFKMDIHYWSRSPKKTPGWTYHADPQSLAADVDFLFVAVVGGPKTENLVDGRMLDALGPDGVLINISRGSVVDEAALLDRLDRGALAGAGLDVFVDEPRADPRFANFDTVVLQPHQASATHATRGAMARLQRDNVVAFLDGKELLTPVV